MKNKHMKRSAYNFHYIGEWKFITDKFHSTIKNIKIYK